MKFCVKDLLNWENLKGVKILGGENNLDNVITGVTIIEAPDIVRFINGGEILLTGLYAFKFCTLDEFKTHIYELEKKKISALIFKRGRIVEQVDEKIAFLEKFAKTSTIPVLEVPFEVSFKDIISQIMEQLFSEEVKRLKYFKTTHDNFEVLTLSLASGENGMEKIMGVLNTMIDNPVAVFNENLICLGATNENLRELKMDDDLRVFEPEVASNYDYLVQQVEVDGVEGKVNQYLIHLNQVFGIKAYLVVTESKHPLDVMDYITIECAITALQYELSRKYAISGLEKKYQYDIMQNILSGKIQTPDELKKNTRLLGLSVDGMYRVIVFGMEYLEEEPQNFNKKVKHMNILNDAVQKYFPEASIHKELDRVVVVQKEGKGCAQGTNRKNMESVVANMQEYIFSLRKKFRVKAGVGKVVEGITNLKTSYREANDALNFIGMAEDENIRVMNFSDMGVLKLLCQLQTQEELMEYIPESLQKLLSYKKGLREELITTLRVYIDKNQNLARTAQELFIHYKTAAYRVEKIIDITGIDFDNAGEVLGVRIGLVAYKMIENYKKQ